MVNVTNGQPKNNFRFPDFLGIGATRAGTTWLGAQFSRQPQIWTPPIKELHWLDSKGSIEDSPIIFSRFFFQRLLSSSHSDRWWRSVIGNRIRNDLLTGNNKNLLWDFRFAFPHYDERWYESLFPKSLHLVRGEISPSYCLLTRDNIRSIAAKNPDLKLIYLLRNPIYRDWSQIRYSHRSSDFDIVGADQLLDLVNQTGLRLRSNYVTAQAADAGRAIRHGG